ncbi:unnamed protein product [Hydatigera taeniaeformis]|uniref:Beta-lactamase domain-containing protein n=1 Tax=Hydatigena taeniaeformis TaxID=6205 RepID=A0A0R3WKC6_HYDTA|nr:unnamed protein product [Hydatigera taeniaeformis]
MMHRALIAATWGLVTHNVNQSSIKNHNGNGCTYLLRDVVTTADQMVEAYKDIVGAPGVSVSVSIDGNIVYCRGFGFADVEQGVKVTPQTKFRIASISKSFTSLLVGRMVDQGQLNLDADIKTYLPGFSPRTKEGNSVSITMRQLLSHTSGIRHYHKSKDENDDEYTGEMLSTKACDSALDSLAIFQNDALLYRPGEDYLYSTHGFTVVAAVLEAIMSKNYPHYSLFERPDRLKVPTGSGIGKMPEEVKSSSLFKELFKFLSLQNTCLDEPYNIVPFRARPYRRAKKNGRLENSPCVNNSCKWSGGGLLSTTPDLVKMASHLADIYMGRLCDLPQLAVVSRDTLVNCLWHPNRGTIQGLWLPGGLYGLGRSTTPIDKAKDSTHSDRLYVGHTGGAIGFTSILFMSLPIAATSTSDESDDPSSASHLPPICVAILANLENAKGIGQLAIHLTELFTAVLLTPHIWPAAPIITAEGPLSAPPIAIAA